MGGFGSKISKQFKRSKGDIGVTAAFLFGGGLVGFEALKLRQAKQAASAVKRDARQQAVAIQKRSDEENKLRRIQAGRVAGQQRARAGAAGVAGSPGLVIQETLLLAFDEIRRNQEASQTQAARTARLGRRQARAMNTQAKFDAANTIIQATLQAITMGMGGVPGAAAGTSLLSGASGSAGGRAAGT